MANNGKKIAIISGVLLSVAIATALVLILVVFKTLATPKNLQVDLVTADPTYQVTISWDDVDNAIAYGVEYKYELREDEVFTENTKIPELVIDRVRGELQFRVKAYNNGNKKDSKFSDWQTYEVSGLKFDLPQEVDITYAYDGASNSYGYAVSEDSINSWENIKYSYRGGSKKVEWYQVVIVPPQDTLENQMTNAKVMSYTTFLNSWHFGLGVGDWSIYIRAINYAEFMGEKEYYSIELYELYGIVDEWREINFKVIDRG